MGSQNSTWSFRSALLGSAARSVMVAPAMRCTRLSSSPDDRRSMLYAWLQQTHQTTTIMTQEKYTRRECPLAVWRCSRRSHKPGHAVHAVDVSQATKQSAVLR